MSLDEAVQMVEKWLAEGKDAEAKRGRDEILKFFPDHEITKRFLEMSPPDSSEPGVEPPQAPHTDDLQR